MTDVVAPRGRDAFSAPLLEFDFQGLATLPRLLKTVDVSQHKSMDTLRDNIRDAGVFKNHAAGGLLRDYQNSAVGLTSLDRPKAWPIRVKHVCRFPSK